MLRVINAAKALQAYAQVHPDFTGVIRVQGDKDIPMNNAYYRITNGKVDKSDEPDATAWKMNIRQLAEFIFEKEHAEMNLMLN